MRGEELIELAMQEPVLCDGAMGTMLYTHGLSVGECPELWNVERSNMVRAIHFAYLQAGSHIISTNTFGANRIKLANYGLSDRVGELNYAGVANAREVAGSEYFVAASVGPTGRLLAPLGDLSLEEAIEVFTEQATAQAEAGADIILVETFSDLEEAKAALIGAIQTGIPCFCTMTFDTGGRTIMGVDPVTATRQLEMWGASGVGANCGVGPEDTIETIRLIKEVASGIVIAQPNAGIPVMSGETSQYTISPNDMAEYAVRLMEAGANIIGGCCGSTPEHIRAMAIALQKYFTQN